MIKSESTKVREAYLLGDIDEDNMRQFIWRIRDLIEKNPDQEITAYITSHGGSLSLAFAFYDFIKIMRAQLTTIALGSADSAAIIILLAGQKRKSGKNTTFLMHQVKRNWHKGASLNPDNLQAESIDLKIKSEKMIRLIAEETAQPIKKIRALIMKEVSLVSEEALNFGLINEII